MKNFLKLATMFSILFVSLSLTSSVIEGSSPPPMPTVYSGSIILGGVIPPDSVVRRVGVRNECVENCVTVKMRDFVSDGGIVNGGFYTVTVGPPDSSYVSSEVTFYYDDLVVADQTDRFMISATFRMMPDFHLTFPDLPTPTPVPTATATATPIPTPSPVPTATAEASPTPASLPAMIFSGTISYVGGGGDVFSDKELLGRVGSYISEPVSVDQISGAGNLGIFDGLVINAINRKFLGKEIHFDFGGLAATNKNPVYFVEGGGELDIELEVEDDTPTEVPPTATKIPPTATSVPPTATKIPPTTTSVPSTATAKPTEAAKAPTVTVPTEVPATRVPTVAPSVPTAVVLVSPEAIPQVEDEGGGCNNPSPVSKLTGAANAIMLFGPLLFVGGYRGWRRRKR